MLTQCADRLVKRLIADGIIERERAGLYSFGFEHGMRTVIELCLMLMTGLFLNKFWQGVIVLLAFTPMRVYAGGYHAKTPMQCLIKSWLLFSAAIVWLKYVPTYLYVQFGIICAVGICLWCFCPVQDEHKPLEDYEIKKYRKKALFFFTIEIFLYVLGYIFSKTEFSRCFVMGMAMVLVLLVSGVVKNKRLGETLE